MEIKLGGRKKGIATVSKEDYDELSKYKWYENNDGYAKVNINKIPMLMHRFIMKVMDERILIDHINNDKLDNSRENLRISDSITNSQNKKIFATKTSSIYRGVFYQKKQKMYKVETVVNGEKINMGTYFSEIQAAEVFDMYLVHVRKDHTKLNFPKKLSKYLKKEYVPYKKQNTKKCKYLGVRQYGNFFGAQATNNGETVHLKFSKDPIECALVRDKYIAENNIPNRTLNFPENHPDYKPKSIIKTKFKSTNDKNIIQLIIEKKPDAIVLINISDYDRIKHYTININSDGYVTIYLGGNPRSKKLSRYLMEVSDPTIFIDHLDGNRSNNCRNNLRLSNSVKNSRNRSKSIKKTASKYLGTFYYKRDDIWAARISYDYKPIQIVSCRSELFAARARDLYILIHYPNEHFKLNFQWKPGDIEKWTAKLTTRRNAHQWIPKSPEQRELEKAGRIVQLLASNNSFMVEKLLSVQKRNSKFAATDQLNQLCSQ